MSFFSDSNLEQFEISALALISQLPHDDVFQQMLERNCTLGLQELTSDTRANIVQM